MSDAFGERIHPATPRRRRQAREDGRVARSHNLAAALLLLAGFGALIWLGRDVVEYLGGLTRDQLGGRAWLTVDAAVAVDWWQTAVKDVGRVLWPLLAGLLAGALASHVGQFGFLFLPHKLAANVERIDPGQGLRRIFSGANGARFCWGLLQAVTVLAVGGVSVWARREQLLALGALDVWSLAPWLGELLLRVGLNVALALLALGVLDFGYQRWRLERDLRMTTQELREEQKTEQALPLAAQRRRKLQRDRASAPAGTAEE